KKTLDETYEKYRQLNIGSDNGFLNLMCLYYIRTKNMTKSREFLDKLKPKSDYIQMQYYRLILEDKSVLLSERIEAQEKISRLSVEIDDIENMTLVIDF
ncbi:hypothetical protein, partial [Vagococcus allomyrinae]